MKGKLYYKIGLEKERNEMVAPGKVLEISLVLLFIKIELRRSFDVMIRIQVVL